MNGSLSWDDLRIVLAITEAGSLSGAARDLGSSHATMFRRLGDIEDRLGVKLFDRGRRGYTPTLAGEQVRTAAARIREHVVDIERRVVGQDLRPSGTVRLTAPDTVFAGLLSPLLAEFRQAYPDISLEVVVASAILSLSEREADIALRPVSEPTDTLAGRRVRTIEQAIYAVPAIARRLAQEADLRVVEWIGPDERMGYRLLAAWMTAQGLDGCCHYRVDTGLAMQAAIRDGAGAGVLPCYLADDDPALERVGDPLPALSADLWLLVHPDMRRTARIRAVMDFLGDRLGHSASG